MQRRKPSAAPDYADASPTATTTLMQWNRYQALLKESPHRMQMLQGVTLALLGNVCSQCVFAPASHRFDVSLAVEQVAINCLVSPPTIMWFRALSWLRLHWAVAAVADQLLFNGLLNIVVWYFVAAFFRGGIEWADGIRIVYASYPSVLAYTPIWDTRVKGMQLKLPTTLLRAEQ